MSITSNVLSCCQISNAVFFRQKQSRAELHWHLFAELRTYNLYNRNGRENRIYLLPQTTSIHYTNTHLCFVQIIVGLGPLL